MARYLNRRREYLTVAKTLPELRQQDQEMFAAGFVKRRGAHGFSEVTRDFYQWWDRAVPASEVRWRATREGLVPLLVSREDREGQGQ